MTEDSGLICTGAVTAIYNLGLHIIERCGSKELASVCSKALLVDPNRNSQAPYIIHRGRAGHRDADMLKAQRYMGDEAALFRLAGQLERAVPWFDRRPPICCQA